MSCKMMEPVISDFAREQMQEIVLRNELLAHCQACAPCAERLNEEQALTTALRATAKASQSLRAPHFVEENLLASLKNGAPGNLSRPVTRSVQPVAAIAAMLFIVLGTVVATYFQRSQSTAGAGKKPDTVASGAKEAAVQTVSSSSVVETKTSPNRLVAFAKSTQRTKQIRRFKRSESQLAANKSLNYASEIATEFLPLGYGNALNLQEGGQIVRVEVPRSTLASFGLPVNLNRDGERVKADVLFGADGLARAIRFVQ